MARSTGWIGVDLDGTLARYEGWQGPEHVGLPILRMTNRVKEWLEDGKDVRIFTARVSRYDEGILARPAIENWTEAVFGARLPVTHEKDFEMVELWDDRAVQVIPNTGRRVGENEAAIREQLDILRRIAQRGLLVGHELDNNSVIDTFQHVLDELQNTQQLFN